MGSIELPGTKYQGEWNVKVGKKGGKIAKVKLPQCHVHGIIIYLSLKTVLLEKFMKILRFYF